MTSIYVFCLILLVMGIVLTIIGILNMINYWVDSDDIPEDECWKYRFIFLGNIVVFMIGLTSVVFSVWVMYRAKNSSMQNQIAVLQQNKDSLQSTESSTLPRPIVEEPDESQTKDMVKKFTAKHETVKEYESYVSHNAEIVSCLYDQIYKNLGDFLKVSFPKEKIQELEWVKQYNINVKDLEQSAKKSSQDSLNILQLIENIKTGASVETIASESDKMDSLIETSRGYVINSGKLVQYSEICLNRINDQISRQLSR